MDQSLQRPTLRSVVDWIRQAPRTTWHFEKQRIRQAYSKSYVRGLLSEGECEHIENLIFERDQEMTASRAGAQVPLNSSAARVIKGAPDHCKVDGQRRSSRTSRKVLTAEERQRYVEKRGRRAFLAKIGIIPAKILRGTCYSTCVQAVLACIAWEVIRTGSCQKPVALLAANAAVCRRTVQMALKQAAEDGLIFVVKRTRLPNHVTIIDESWSQWVRTWIFLQSRKDRYNDDSYMGAETCTHRSEGGPTGSLCRSADCGGGSVKEQPLREAASRERDGEAARSETVRDLRSDVLEESLAAFEMLVFADYPVAAREDELIDGARSVGKGLVADLGATRAYVAQRMRHPLHLSGRLVTGPYGYR